METKSIQDDELLDRLNKVDFVDVVEAPTLRKVRIAKIKAVISIALLFVNFFLSQYDKFILSYFSVEITADLSITTSQYGVLSGYATGVIFAVAAIPIAYIADRLKRRSLVIAIASAWWSLMVVFQGLSKTFWQIILARIGMGIGQAAAESLSVSLISDWLPPKYASYGQSFLYMGIYIGEAISGNISTVFRETGTSWRYALIAIGVVGIIVAILIVIIIREPPVVARAVLREETGERLVDENSIHFMETLRYLLCMRSFWIITVGGGARELSGYVFGYYMPAYLQLIYPDVTLLTTYYGIVVGVAGSIAVVIGGVLTHRLFAKRNDAPLLIAAWGGAVSSIFVLLMIFSKDSGGGLALLLVAMSLAYLTAEMWLGPLASLLVLTFPPRYKTFGYAVYITIITLIASSGPEIVGLALSAQGLSPVGSPDAVQAYLKGTKILLAVVIPAGYVIAAACFLWAAYQTPKPVDDRRESPLVDSDSKAVEKLEGKNMVVVISHLAKHSRVMTDIVDALAWQVTNRKVQWSDISRARKWGHSLACLLLGAAVIALLVASLVVGV